MAIEVERKFLVTADTWRAQVQQVSEMSQAYLNDQGRASVRVRIEDQQATLNIKQAVAGPARLEFEYPIPLGDARQLISRLGGGRIEKRRHRVPAGRLTWEIDEFLGANAGLIVAEIELPSPATPFDRPAWLGQDVTDDPRYYNHQLAQHPYTQWGTV
ncbi:MAG: CYTH domain-containing protein [Abyssibacter sp.]|uniref:CYTH domain-containing protein n=1 Tax=Abyssibacter sp. TaxID=2320200 RepID=UPI00321A3373